MGLSEFGVRRPAGSHEVDNHKEMGKALCEGGCGDNTARVHSRCHWEYLERECRHSPERRFVRGCDTHTITGPLSTYRYVVMEISYSL